MWGCREIALVLHTGVPQARFKAANKTKFGASLKRVHAEDWTRHVSECASVPCTVRAVPPLRGCSLPLCECSLPLCERSTLYCDAPFLSCCCSTGSTYTLAT